MELPILEILTLLLAAFIGGRLAMRIGYPSVLGELAAGIILGPPLLGILQSGEAIAVLAEVGVLLMMLYIGMEIDPRELGKASSGGILAALGGFVVPFALGVWVVTFAGGAMIAGVFVGMAMGVTSLATKSRILVDLRILDTRIAHVMMAGALVADTLSLLIFAGITSVVSAGSLDFAAVAWIALRVVVFFALAWLVGVRVLPAAWRFMRRRGIDRAGTVPLLLLVAFAFAEAAHLAGLHGILGTFVAGLALREAIGERRMSHDLTGLVRDVSLGFLAPIFFVTAGFEVTFNVFVDAPGLLFAVIILATLGKILGTVLAYLPTGHGWREGTVIGLGMNGRGAVEIIIAGIGLQAGIIDRTIFSILVFMAIATTATVPLFLTWGVRWLEGRGELVRSAGRVGTLIVGAGPLARQLARKLSDTGPVTLLDRNAEAVNAARAEGLEAIHGDALDGATLQEAGVEDIGWLVALTPNPEVNVLTAQRARERWLVPEVMALLPREHDGGLFSVLEAIGGHVAFGRPVDLIAWDARLAEGEVQEDVETITEDNVSTLAAELAEGPRLPLAVVRGGAAVPFGKELPNEGEVLVLEVKTS